MSTLEDLAALTDAVYRADLARLQAIATEEAKLRAEIAGLVNAAQESESLAGDSIDAMRQVGGDLLWKAWIGRKREALNIRLAAVLARKAAASDRLSRSFGKTTVSASLRDLAHREHAAAIAMRELSAVQDRMVLDAASARSRGTLSRPRVRRPDD